MHVKSQIVTFPPLTWLRMNGTKLLEIQKRNGLNGMNLFVKETILRKIVRNVNLILKYNIIVNLIRFIK